MKSKLPSPRHFLQNPPIDTGALGRLEVDVEITPFVFGFGVGRRF